jgi:16S rRNA (cytosine967-C5)-methyltransferase
VRELEGAIGADDALVAARVQVASRDEASRRDRRRSSGLVVGKARQLYGEDERKALAQAWLAAAPLDLRINPLKTTRDEARADARRHRGSPHSRPPTLRSGSAWRAGPRSPGHPLFESALSKCRTRAASSYRFWWRPNAPRWSVDFCAGAGGKTLLLGALMRSQGRLYALDTTTGGSANLKPRLRRSGLSNVHTAMDRSRAGHER